MKNFHTGYCYNTRYHSETHSEPNISDTSAIYNTHCSCRIVPKFCTECGSIMDRYSCFYLWFRSIGHFNWWQIDISIFHFYHNSYCCFLETDECFFMITAVAQPHHNQYQPIHVYVYHGYTVTNLPFVIKISFKVILVYKWTFGI